MAMLARILRLRGARAVLVWSLQISVAIGLAGCGRPLAALGRPGGAAKLSVEQVERARLERDIVAIAPHYNPYPWLLFDVTNPRPQGFKIDALYLISAKTGKGVFGDGIIRVKMYRVERDEAGAGKRTLVHVWEFDPQAALPYRCVRRTVLGYGYQLHLKWPDDCDVLGKEISVVVEFVRRDGKVIRSHPKSFIVPLSVSG